MPLLLASTWSKTGQNEKLTLLRKRRGREIGSICDISSNRFKLVLRFDKIQSTTDYKYSLIGAEFLVRILKEAKLKRLDKNSGFVLQIFDMYSEKAVFKMCDKRQPLNRKL